MNVFTIVALVTTVGQLHAATISVPESIDFTKTSAGFKYSEFGESGEGRKKSWTAWLMPKGNFFVSGIYFGENSDSCSSRGGDAEGAISNERRQELMKLALLSHNENATSVPANSHGEFESGPNLSIELGHTMADITISKFETHTNDFRREVSLEVEKVFANPQFRKIGLEVAVSV